MTLHDVVVALQTALDAGRVPAEDVSAIEQAIPVIQIMAGSED